MSHIAVYFCGQAHFLQVYRPVTLARRRRLGRGRSEIPSVGQGFARAAQSAYLHAAITNTAIDRPSATQGEVVMHDRCATVAVAVALAMGLGGAQAADYPDWSGQWMRFAVPGLPGQPSHDQTKPWGRGQQAPLTPEYQAVLEASIADQAIGGLGNFPTTLGRAAGMPHMMMAFLPIEFVVTPKATYVLIGMYDHYRRIYTDGRDWPKDIVPTYAGYSIGRWADSGGEGHYDVLEVETRGFKGPRAYDETGLPLHTDNQSIFRERIYAQPKPGHAVAGILHHRIQRAGRYRRAELFPERGWPPDAGQEGPTAARFALFQTGPAVTRYAPYGIDRRKRVGCRQRFTSADPRMVTGAPLRPRRR
jgi:hypothetical protein